MSRLRVRDLDGSRTKGIKNRGTQVHSSKKKYSRIRVGKLFNCEDNMSGGYFRHEQSALKAEASHLQEVVRLNKPEFGNDTLELLKYVNFIMEKTVELVDEADWLLSGNITEKQFREGALKYRKEIITHTP